MDVGMHTVLHTQISRSLNGGIYYTRASVLLCEQMRHIQRESEMIKIPFNRFTKFCFIYESE